eukprot:1138005-Pelagomonas_calceolata.AAC.6
MQVISSGMASPAAHPALVKALMEKKRSRSNDGDLGTCWHLLAVQHNVCARRSAYALIKGTRWVAEGRDIAVLHFKGTCLQCSKMCACVHAPLAGLKPVKAPATDRRISNKLRQLIPGFSANYQSRTTPLYLWICSFPVSFLKHDNDVVIP